MEQTLPLSESSTMPTRKLSVMRWVAFVLALITGFGFLIFFTFFFKYFQVDDIGFLSMIINCVSIFVELVLFVFLMYLSSNRAVRNAMAVAVATWGLLLLISIFDVVWRIEWMSLWGNNYLVINSLLTVYAFSIVIMNTKLSSEKKGWFTILCVGWAVNIVVSIVTQLILDYPNVQQILGIAYYDSYRYILNPMNNVVFWGLTLFSTIAWYQVIFSDAFAYMGFKKDDDGVVYRYPFFNRYTVGMFISSAVVLLLMYLSIVVTL